MAKDDAEKTAKEEPVSRSTEPQARAGAQAGGIAPEGFKLIEEGSFTSRSDYFAGSLAITEALLAFGKVSRDGSREIKIDAKIVMSVRDAKRVHLTLQQLITQYEEKYGQIVV